MSKLEKLYNFIESSKEVGVKLPNDVLRQVEELEEKIIKEEILPALSNVCAQNITSPWFSTSTTSVHSSRGAWLSPSK